MHRQMQFVSVRLGYDLQRWACSQQMVGEIKSVTQAVTMEFKNTPVDVSV